MKRMLALLVLCLFSTSVFADDVDKHIRSTVASVEEAIAAGNLDKTVAMYADDAVLMPMNEPAVRGGEAIRKWWGGMLALGKANLEITIEDISTSGDIAVERGTWALTLMPTGAPAPVKDNGKYVIVWRKRDGMWKVMTDIFNSDLPLPK